MRKILFVLMALILFTAFVLDYIADERRQIARQGMQNQQVQTNQQEAHSAPQGEHGSQNQKNNQE